MKAIVMIGNRVDGKSGLNPGEYFRHASGIWFAMTPNGYMANLANHDVRENEDETITVSPSILVSTRIEGGEPDEVGRTDR